MENIKCPENKTLAYSLEDIEKANTSEGCQLNLVKDKISFLDHDDDEGMKFFGSDSDDDFSDHEDSSDQLPTTIGKSINQEQPSYTLCNQYPQSGLERMKREFISLTTNANRDPIRGESRENCKKLLFPDLDAATANEETNKSNYGAESSLESSYEEDQVILRGKSFEALRDDHNIIHGRYEKSRFNFNQLLVEKNFEDIDSPAGRVFKKLIAPGHGPRLTENSLIIYNCACWTERQREPYDSTWLRRNTYISDITKDSILPGIRELLLTTRKGEWCEALIKPAAAFGELGVKPRIPANAIIYCLMEIVNIIPKDKISILAYNPQNAQSENKITFDEFLTAADEARKRGNYFHDMRQFRIALHRYRSGIRIMETLVYKNELEEKRAKDLLLKLYNNVARVANELGLPRLALAACKQASLIDEFNPKTYWYRTQAWKLKGHPDLALNVVKRALALFRKDEQTVKYFKRQEEDLIKKIHQEKDQITRLHRLMGQAVVS